MERVFNHFVHRHVLPVFLLPVAAFGCLCLAFLSVAFQPAPDQPFAIVCFTLGILGSDPERDPGSLAAAHHVASLRVGADRLGCAYCHHLARGGSRGNSRWP